MSNTPVPPSVDTLSRWTIEAKNNNGWILLGISKLFFLAAVMAFWLMKADASSQVERIFFMTVWIVMLASVAGSLIPQTRRFEKFLENYDSFVVFGQVLLCAIISVKFCDEGLDCTTTISKNNIQSCLACYNLNGPNFGNLNSGLQLRVGKQGLSLLVFLLCEISNSRMLYSTIPLQVLFISLPSLSEGEAAASIISVCGSLLICVVKVVQISHNKLAKPESAKQLPDNMVINMPMSGKKSNLKGITKQPYSRAAGELDRQVFITHQMHQVSADSASGEQALNAKREKPVHWDHPGSGPVLVKKTFVKETQKEIYSYQSRPKVSFAPVEVQSRKQSYGVSGNLVDRGRTNPDEETEDHEGDQLSVKAMQYDQFAPIIFWASDSFTLVAQRDLKIVLNTYEDRVHGEVMAQIQKSFLRIPDANSESESNLEDLFVDVPLPTNFDQLTAMNLRLIAETIVHLTADERTLYEVTADQIGSMQSLIQEMTEIPRESMKEVSKKMKHHSPLAVLRFMNSTARELKETLKTAAADDFAAQINPSMLLVCIKSFIKILLDFNTSASNLENLIKKIELEFLMSHSVSLFFKVINYEQEYFVVVSISAASDARIYQINASKAEYMTMMVNSLSHEIITPISEILKHCDLPRIKMHPSHRNLPGSSKLQMTTPCFGVTVSSPDFKNSPGFTFGSQNRMVTPLHGLNLGSSRGLEVKSFGLTMQHAIGGERRECAGISPMQTGEATPFTPFSILTKESHPSGTSIKPRSSPRSASPTNRAMDNDITQSKLRQSAYMINMEHMDIPDEDRYVGTCGLLAQQRKRFSMENSKLQHRVMSKEDSPSAILPMLSNAPVLEGMKQIKRIANRIQLFVDGLMGYSQILTQRFEPQVSNSYRVTDLLRETAELFEEKCAYKGISIEINCPLKLEINTDRKKLSSVFLIFLDNAVKFMNQKGRIVLSASCSSYKVSVPSGVPKPLPHQQTFIKNFTMREDSSPKGKQQMPFFEPESEERDIITFQIQDQGMGINKRDMEIIKYTLSNPFNTSPTSSSAGLGIGLRIAQAIISELSIGNGKLEIMSQIGEGTTVIFEIPTEPEIRAEELEPSIIETGLKKSDTIFNDQIQIEGRLNTVPQEEAVGEPTSSKILGGSERKILKSSLPHISNSDSLHSPAKASPVQASPKLHLEFKKSFSKTHTLATPMAGIRTPYDPASQNLVQLHSPSFADLASSFNRKSLPAHMASNTPKGTHLIDDSQIEPRSKKVPAEKARFSLRMDSMHHSKTIKTPDFHKRSNTRDSSKMIKFFTQGIAASLTSLFGQSETKKVMIVDDEVFLLEFLREILESLGLEVYTANSPERAFELTTSLGNMSKKINLVYMDYNMPNMNGAECTKILKSEVHKRVMEGAWFTVQTAQNDKLVRDQFKAVGVTDFLSKPYTFDQIVQHLKARGLLVEN